MSPYFIAILVFMIAFAIGNLIFNGFESINRTMIVTAVSIGLAGMTYFIWGHEFYHKI
ncbi:hypothetical protein CFREI_00945 [Corynebacterium freiburgense]|nr:hypothetical protein CFREI_00945 [Corynebacterium freiburgense]